MMLQNGRGNADKMHNDELHPTCGLLLDCQTWYARYSCQWQGFDVLPKSVPLSLGCQTSPTALVNHGDVFIRVPSSVGAQVPAAKLIGQYQLLGVYAATGDWLSSAGFRQPKSYTSSTGVSSSARIRRIPYDVTRQLSGYVGRAKSDARAVNRQSAIRYQVRPSALRSSAAEVSQSVILGRHQGRGFRSATCSATDRASTSVGRRTALVPVPPAAERHRRRKANRPKTFDAGPCVRACGRGDVGEHG